MKKEEIEDRLMDALLRGECEEDLGANVKEEASRTTNRGNFVRAVLGVAAVLAMAAVGVSVWNKNQSAKSDVPILTTAHAEVVKEAEKELARLDAEIEEQKARVEAKRKVLKMLTGQSGEADFDPDLELSEEFLQAAADENAFKMKKERSRYSSYLQKIDQMSGEVLYIYLSGLPGEENSVAKLYPDFLQARVEVERLQDSTLELSPDELAQKKKKLAELTTEIEVAAQQMKKNLFGVSDALSKQLKVMEKVSKEEEAQLVALATAKHDYQEATREYESALAELQELKLEHLLAKRTVEGKRFLSQSGQGSTDSTGVDEEIPSRKVASLEEEASIGNSQSQVIVMGSVESPGSLLHGEKMTVADAIEQAGGVSTFGTSSRVTVRREGKKYPLDLRRNEKHRLEPIYPGDVIEVDQVKAWESGGDEKVADLASKAVDFSSSDDFGIGWGRGGQGGGGSFFGMASPKSENKRRLRLHSKDRFAEGQSENYGQLVDQPWKDPRREALSTFSVDVDTASYTNLRRLLNSGADVPADAVRIEELVNYFDYDYPQPVDGAAFGVGLEMATCPWQPQHNLVRVALQGKVVKQEDRGDANLVFLVDVSGSMRDSDKLPLLVESLGLMVEELRESDSVAIVVYAGNEGLALKPTRMGQGGRETVLEALGKLAAGGSTNGGAGIKLAYRLAQENFVEGGINRVILATDGDFNVGITGQDNLVQLVKEKATKGVFLSVCGFGRGNLNDSLLEAITNKGNGVYYYIDSLKEGRRVFLKELMGTLVTIAKDVKIQMEFNPAKVAHYRLIGYANRILAKEDFNDDQVDAGDIGSGHQVTAFYEVVPVGVAGTVRPKVDDLKYQSRIEKEDGNDSQDWLTAKLRHKKPEEEVSTLQEFVLKGEAKPWASLDADFRFAAGVAMWGMGLRGMDDLPKKQDVMLELLGGAAGKSEKRAELLELLRQEE